MSNKLTLFLGDLSAFCTEGHIHDLFGSHGLITEIKIMRSEETQRNLSYGFIKFSSTRSAESALALDGILFCGRKLRVGWAAYRNKKEPKLCHHEKVDSSSIHFSYISYQSNCLITEESLRLLFSNYGEVLDTSVKKAVVDETINRQCGYGFVHYSSSRSGIHSALAAVKDLNDATFLDVHYKCSISHSLERHLLEVQLDRLGSRFCSETSYRPSEEFQSTENLLHSNQTINHASGNVARSQSDNNHNCAKEGARPSSLLGTLVIPSLQRGILEPTAAAEPQKFHPLYGTTAKFSREGVTIEADHRSTNDLTSLSLQQVLPTRFR